MRLISDSRIANSPFALVGILTALPPTQLDWILFEFCVRGNQIDVFRNGLRNDDAVKGVPVIAQGPAGAWVQCQEV
jgi:hypothetical protein